MLENRQEVFKTATAIAMFIKGTSSALHVIYWGEGDQFGEAVLLFPGR